METLGQRLKKAREVSRYTQKQVAEKLGISNGTLSGYERDYRDPDTDTLSRLAEIYGVSIDWLKGRDNVAKNSVTLNEVKMMLIEEFDKLPEEDQKYIISLIRRIPKK